MSTTRVALVPGVLALLPEYAGIEDPVADLRAACLEAVAWLGGDVEVVGDEQGRRVGEWLLDAAGVSRQALARLPQPPAAAPLDATEVSTSSTGGATADRGDEGAAYLVVGNGSACRTEKAPGFLDERAERFDAELGASLRAGRFEVNEALAAELLASVEGVVAVGRRVRQAELEQVDYDGAPYGVQYWVMRWRCES